MPKANDDDSQQGFMSEQEISDGMKRYEVGWTTVTDLSSGRIGKSRYAVFEDYLKVTDKRGKDHFFTATFMNDKGSPNFYIFSAKKGENGSITHEVLESCAMGSDGMRHLVNGPTQEIYRNGVHGLLKAEFVSPDYVRKALYRTRA